MARYVVLSVNDDPVYLYYVPLARWAWMKIGWTPIIMYRGSYSTELAQYATTNFDGLYVDVKSIEGYRDDTITQVSRLYAGHIKLIGDDDVVMTADIDLIPLSDHWNADPKQITCYGHDLADFKHYPMCYISMTKAKWMNVMDLQGDSIKESIKRDLDRMPQAKDPDFFRYWFSDQDLITKKLNGYPVVSVLRGKIHNGLAQGRVDRGEWSMKHNGNFIDAHLHRDLYKRFQNPNDERYALFQKKWEEHMTLLHTVWPDEDWTDYAAYTKRFAELAQ